jgi:hypothetical protein
MTSASSRQIRLKARRTPMTWTATYERFKTRTLHAKPLDVPAPVMEPSPENLASGHGCIHLKKLSVMILAGSLPF